MKKFVSVFLAVLIEFSFTTNINLIYASEIRNGQKAVAKSSSFVDSISYDISSTGYYANSTFKMKCTGTISVYLEKNIGNSWGCVSSNFVTFSNSYNVYANKNISLSSGLYRLVVTITTSDDSYSITSSSIYI